MCLSGMGNWLVLFLCGGPVKPYREYSKGTYMATTEKNVRRHLKTSVFSVFEEAITNAGSKPPEVCDAEREYLLALRRVVWNIMDGASNKTMLEVVQNARMDKAEQAYLEHLV